MMLRLLRFHKTISLLTTAWLVAMSVSSGIAAACEPQVIGLRPILWSGGARCPEVEVVVGEGRRIRLEREREWCEFEVKNENAREEVTVESLQAGYQPGGECERILCLETIRPPREECEARRTRLVRGRSCFVRLEYFVRPRRPPERAAFRVLTKSARNLPGRAEVGLYLE